MAAPNPSVGTPSQAVAMARLALILQRERRPDWSRRRRRWKWEQRLRWRPENSVFEAPLWFRRSSIFLMRVWDLGNGHWRGVELANVRAAVYGTKGVTNRVRNDESVAADVRRLILVAADVNPRKSLRMRGSDRQRSRASGRRLVRVTERSAPTYVADYNQVAADVSPRRSPYPRAATAPNS